MSKGLFVTGTDTEIGKTYVSAEIIRTLVNGGNRVASMKPIASGGFEDSGRLYNEDALTLMQAANVSMTYAQANPYVFEPAIAPHLAARDLGVQMSIGLICDIFAELAGRSDWVIVEGVGGWLVPIGAGHTLADLAQALSVPVVLVVGIRLGCINHALLSVESIMRHGLTLAGWIANHCEPGTERAADIVSTLEELISRPRLATIGYGQASSGADDGPIALASLLSLR